MYATVSARNDRLLFMISSPLVNEKFQNYEGAPLAGALLGPDLGSTGESFGMQTRSNAVTTFAAGCQVSGLSQNAII